MSSSPTNMCERCDGLCCRVYDIVDSDTGKLIKKWWVKCGYLDIKNRCRIHKTRSEHIGFRDSCEIYDCLEGGPIVTIFARRIPDSEEKFMILSSLLETIRKRITISPESRNDILQFTASLLNNINIDQSLSISTRVARVKIERWGG